MSFEEKRRRLISMLENERYIITDKVKKAMLKVPRELFVTEEYRNLSYSDRPLPIGHGQTISAPSIVAYMTELLKAEVGHKVLEIGTGSGYQAAVLAEVVAPDKIQKKFWGHVFSVERIPELAKLAIRNLSKAGYSNRVTVIVGDGTEGFKDEAPYDRIIVTAAAPDIPEPLLDQLKPGGIMVIPIGSKWEQNLVVIEKEQGERVKIRRDIDVIFVPLIGKHGWDEFCR